MLLVALAFLGVKLCIAAATIGTNDVQTWTDFARGVKAAGPVGVYGFHFPSYDLYNHPPLVGYFLVIVNFLAKYGVPLKFTLRAASSLADVASALLIFELVLRRRSRADAILSGILVAASPILFMVSGFHGNTDPIFTMLVLFGLYLLVDLKSPVLAGLAIALAVSIKLVPIVVIPAMLVYSYRRGLPMLRRFAIPLIALGTLIWAPALLRDWGPIRRNVLGYTGVVPRWWGIPQFAQWAGFPGVGNTMAKASFLIVVVCAAGAAVLVFRRPALVVETSSVALCVFLLLSPAFGVQYLVWPLAPAYLIGIAGATAFNVAGATMLFYVYTHWSGEFPWYFAGAKLPTSTQRVLTAVVWIALLAVVFEGVSVLRSPIQGARLAPTRRGKRQWATSTELLDPVFHHRG